MRGAGRAQHFVMILVAVVLTSACATVESGRKITPDDVAFIQKGVTTRTEVVQRIGAPIFEGPDWTRLSFESTTTTTTVKATTTEGETEKSKSVTTVETKPTPMNAKALYIHTKSEGSAFTGIRTTQEQFYVIYDSDGIVQDFGFQPGTGITVR